MTQYLLLKSDGDTDNQDVALTSDSTSEGGVLGGDNYTASETVNASSIITGNITSFNTTETSGTTGTGVRTLGQHTDLTASLTTDTVSSALRSAIATTVLTSQPQAVSDAVSDISLATAQALTSAEESVSDALASIQSTSVSMLDSTSSGDALPDATRASVDGTSAIGVGTTSVTPLGAVEVASGDPLTPDSILEIISFVTPENVGAQPLTTTEDTSTSITALTQNAALVSLTPTTSILINVKKTGIGIEGAFADSLSASVGANTTIKVAKTQAPVTTFTGDVLSESQADLVRTVVAIEDQLGDVLAESTVDSLRATVEHEVLGTSASDSTTLADAAETALTEFDGTVDTSAVTDAEIESALADAVTVAAQTDSTSQALRAAVTSLTQDGTVDSEATAALAVATALADTFTTAEETSTNAEALLSELDVTNYVGRTAAFFLLFRSMTGTNSVDIEIEQNNVRILN